MLEVCGSSLLWGLHPMGVVGRLACQGFLVMEACIRVLVGGAESRLSECREVPRSEFLGVYGFGVTLDSLYIEA